MGNTTLLCGWTYQLLQIYLKNCLFMTHQSLSVLHSITKKIEEIIWPPPSLLAAHILYMCKILHLIMFVDDESGRFGTLPLSLIILQTICYFVCAIVQMKQQEVKNTKKTWFNIIYHGKWMVPFTYVITLLQGEKVLMNVNGTIHFKW